MADATGLPDWQWLRPPRVALSPAQRETLRSAMAQAGFRIDIAAVAAA